MPWTWFPQYIAKSWGRHTPQCVNIDSSCPKNIGLSCPFSIVRSPMTRRYVYGSGFYQGGSGSQEVMAERVECVKAEVPILVEGGWLSVN